MKTKLEKEFSEALRASTPMSRLSVHIGFFKKYPHAEAGWRIENVKRWLENDICRSKRLLLLSELDTLRTQIESDIDPNTNCGKKQRKGASDGGNARSQKFREDYHVDDWQGEIDSLAVKQPLVSYNSLMMRIVKKYHVSISTVKNHTSNPHKKAG